MSNSKKKRIANRVSMISVPFRNGGVALMNHPASLTLYKYVSVTVLSGSITINGYEINKENGAFKVFSSEKTGLIEVKTESYDSIWKKETDAYELEKDLDGLLQSHDTKKKILQMFGNSTVAIFIQRCALPCNVEFAEFYYPQPFEFNLYKKGTLKEPYYLEENKKTPISFGDEEEKLASEIHIMIRRAKFGDGDCPRVLVCGPRNTGKSTLLQYLLNRILTQQKYANYLDTDPGQPQFTPPGVVSLTRLSKPVIGPPFFQQDKDKDKNTRMIFIGDISPSSIDMYRNSIYSLMKFYSAKFHDEPLFVNTMGWMEGTGLTCLKETIAIVKPTVLIEIVAVADVSMFDYRDCLPDGSQYFQICCKHEQKTLLSAKEMRELTLLSHLGNCQAPYLGILPANEIKPYCVSWDKIPIFIFPGENIQPFRMVEAINGSIVALCSVAETCILSSTESNSPMMLEPDPANKCLAYGLVRAVDEKEHILYIISPLKIHELANVNAIIKGKVMVPDALIMKQEIYDVPLPHTDIEISSPEEEVADVSMVSLKYVSETEVETPASDLTAFSSLENYRKPIGKRYCHKFSKKSFKKIKT